MPAKSHAQVHEVRDPLYGFVKLSESEWEVVNSVPFQRLRDIRQLAMGYMVYPGANHTRFEHSLGCLHLASLMFDALVERNGDMLKSEFGLVTEDASSIARQTLRLAAMLHDVGHAPFSHSGEGLLPVDPKKKGNGPVKHETMSARIIRESEISDIIKQNFGQRGIDVEAVIAVGTEFSKADKWQPLPHHTFLHELLTGELGADRVDYLLRDAYHSGQKAGDFDYRRLVGSLTMVAPPIEAEQSPRIGFDSGGWLVAEQMIVARYLMYQSLYFHKTKRIFEIHLEQFMHDWLKGQKKRSLPWDVKDYVSVSDSDVLAELHEAGKDVNACGHLVAKRFHDRSHLRLAHEVILADNFVDDGTGSHRLPDKKRFGKLRDKVRLKFGGLICCDEPDHSATKIFGDTTKILVSLDGASRYLDDVSEIVRGMSSKIWRGRIYADPSIRNEAKSFCKKWLAKNPMQGKIERVQR